jgi:hypothetical protein
VRLRALGRVGLKLVGAGWLLGFVPSLWAAEGHAVSAASNIVTGAGLADVIVFLIANVVALAEHAGRLSVEADDRGVRILMDAERCDCRPGLWRAQAGLARWTPAPAPPAVSADDMRRGFVLLGQALAAFQTAMPREFQEKRLVPRPPSKERWMALGVEFPDEPEWSYRDRLGRLQEPFMVHYRVVDADELGPAFIEVHGDPHPGCPGCGFQRRRP